jgi:hypothetical protein
LLPYYVISFSLQYLGRLWLILIKIMTNAYWNNKKYYENLCTIRNSRCAITIFYNFFSVKYNHELHKEFNSPNALKVTNTSWLRYAGPMIRRPKDLPQKALFRAKPNGRRNQVRPKSRWADRVNSDSLALGVRYCTHCAQDRQTWRDLLQQALTRYWL